MRDEYLIMLGAWLVVGIWIALVIFWNRKTHPKALFFLFLVELWERFSYYGMRALLVLYLTSRTITGGFEIDKESAYGIYAAYGALVYLTPLLGGFSILPVVSSGQTGLQAPETFRRTRTLDLLYMAGGGILAHPGGAAAGVTAIRQAWEAAVAGVDLDAHARDHVELRQQIEKFGGGGSGGGGGGRAKS